MCLYLPVIVSGMIHLLVYPVLMALIFFWSQRTPVLQVVLKDRLASKLLFGFCAVSFAFLVVWLHVAFEPARVVLSSAYVVFAILLGRKLETLAYKVWNGTRTCYQV
ncbi:hypothetical protein GCM10007876_30100 [Litoribrevibacter albus]|uniref:Uncharacterized protein n=2 Tax=Litoribrevibacter albus TaxID=1473156 RepID=A0AA37W9E7_9GAMM|nr:hypothetical protein GCM10007876_30100 [Litoribrevibacter albus]